MKYKRILLKLSGEALLGDLEFGIDPKRVNQYTDEICDIMTNTDLQMAIVIGGGNIFRGMQASEIGIDRVSGDYMGMMATIMNGVALQNALERKNIKTRLLSALEINKVCEPYIKRRAARHLEKGRVIIFVAGTGNPFFTTDTAAGLRAVEMEADVILKGTRVDGIYNADPEKNPDAIKYNSISFDDVLSKGYKVMDATAFTLCRENNLPIVVFNMNEPGNLSKLLAGDKIGTLVS